MTLNNIEYCYDSLSRTIKETNFVYQNNQIIEIINEKYTIKFKYNLNKLIGFIYTSGSSKQEFIYLRNIQGDITSIYDEEGNEVASYNYDSYGNVEIIKNINNIATINPFRYRGYYYDEESNLYYLNSRYYDSETCRFISPDSIVGLNLYAYCENNPTNYYDPTGHSAILIGLIIGAVIGGAVGFGTAAYIDYQDDGQVFNGSVAWYDYLGSIILGGAIGEGVGAGIGYIAPQIGSALSSFTTQQFTFGLETYLTASEELEMTAGLTITGAQILQGAGILSGITIMASIIGKSGGYTVKKFPDDYDPTHVHIFGDDIADKAHGIRIGLDGNPLPGQGKLPPGARKALKKLWELILKALSK